MKTSAGGKTWAQFSVAVNTGEDEATWLRVAVSVTAPSNWSVVCSRAGKKEEATEEMKVRTQTVSLGSMAFQG
jgi:hypothetical protein